ncbi:MAG: hypothetical protein JST00_16730 [Deltaproteobacteria bacterium]|nr:hypothetical protein [Deltaproteobacteria bacterium]
MKLSLVFASASLLSLAALSVGCSTTDEEPSIRRAPTAEPEPTPPAPTATPRKLVEGNALPTSPVNLIADPGFGLVGQETGYGSFLAITESDFSQIELVTKVDSRSPAGFGGSVASVRPDGATATASEPVLVLTSFQGGAGPFRAQVWVSQSTLGGAPKDVTIDPKGIRATVTDETPDGEAFDLAVVESATRKVGDRTWVLLRGEVNKALTYGGFFVVRTGSGGGQFEIAAPEIVAQPLVDGLASTKSLGTTARSLAPRVKTQAERSAITKYKSRVPRLMPAGAPAKRR